MKFEELPLNSELLSGLEAMNFKETTPIQELAIPIILQKKDLIACAQTGTGKTAAFLLPMINNLLESNNKKIGVKAIIMSPTRELAQQIDQQMEGFSYFVPITSAAVYGGNDATAWDTQRNALKKGAEVIVATPGRLISHINLSTIDFSQVEYFILDEADRMLDMGFYDDIMNIVKELPTDRQTLLFSATMPPAIRKLANNILQQPEEVSIAISRPPESIMQTAYICEENQKLKIIRSLFSDNIPTKTIIFSGKKQRVKELKKTIKSMGMEVEEMHSDLDQKDREDIMLRFKNNYFKILVATDIVSRGIDIDDIDLVINYEVPYDVEDYVHRIGRTARAGDDGLAITLVGVEEQFRFKQIEDFLKKSIFKIPLPKEIGEAPKYEPKEMKKNRFFNKKKSSKKPNKQYKKKNKD